MGYADVEKMLVAWLPTAIDPAPRVGVATPADPGGTYSWVADGFIRVHRVGGPRRFGLDTARVILECFGASYGAAADLASAVSDLFDGPILGLRILGGSVNAAQTDSAPSWVPYDDVNVERFESHHTLVVHSMQ